METYFAFSDECGKYKKEKSESFLTSNPYYVRSALIIKAKDWKSLNADFLTYKEMYELRKTFPKSDARNYGLKIALNGSFG